LEGKKETKDKERKRENGEGEELAESQPNGWRRGGA